MTTEYPVKVSVAASMEAAMTLHPELRSAGQAGVVLLHAPTVSPSAKLDTAKLTPRLAVAQPSRGPKA